MNSEVRFDCLYGDLLLPERTTAVLDIIQNGDERFLRITVDGSAGFTFSRPIPEGFNTLPTVIDVTLELGGEDTFVACFTVGKIDWEEEFSMNTFPALEHDPHGEDCEVISFQEVDREAECDASAFS